MKKLIKKGRVKLLNENKRLALYLDDDRGVGFSIEGMLTIEKIPFNEETFKPYLEKVVSIMIEREEGKVPKIIITEEKENESS
jgi:hypothetical protein